MLHYVDDAFNVPFTDECSLYKPYNCLMPTAQAWFLEILDFMGLLHNEAKQVHGEILEIIRPAKHDNMPICPVQTKACRSHP